MKKLHILATASILATLISGCANNPPVPETGKPPVPTPADTSSTVNDNDENKNDSTPSTEQNNQAQAADDSMKSMQAPGPDLTSQPTASIKLSQKGDQIIARVTTNWDNANQGDLYLKWIAPKGTTCHNTQLPITKYKESNDISTAKRPITSLYSDKDCNGEWKVQVITKNGSDIADNTINIKPTSTQPGS
jgi:subtilisin-like proprotein convertase family protein